MVAALNPGFEMLWIQLWSQETADVLCSSVHLLWDPGMARGAVPVAVAHSEQMGLTEIELF